MILAFLESSSTPCALADYHTAQHQLYEFVWIRRAGQAKALARTLLTQWIVGAEWFVYPPIAYGDQGPQVVRGAGLYWITLRIR